MRSLRWIGLVSALELANAAFWFGLAVLLAVLARQAAVHDGPDSAKEVAGLKLASGVMLVPATVVLLAWFGLRKRKLWGWWLALLANVAVTGLFIDSMIDDGWSNFDWSMVALTATFATATALLLWPPVRRCYWQRAALETGLVAGTSVTLNPPQS